MSALKDQETIPPLPHRFGVQPDFTLGIEEELLLVEPDGSALQPCAEQLIASAPSVPGRLASEIFAAEVELVTPICRSIHEGEISLRELTAAVAAAHGTMLGAGLHPTDGLAGVTLSTSTRYAALSDALQGLLRNPPAGLHVHVGMPDADTALSVANRMRRHLPLLHSLGANSPFWFGRDSGLASARAAILRSYPRYGVPPWYPDWSAFSALVYDLADAADVADYTYFWWDVRLHPRLGTVEVRAPDTQFSLERTLALAALIQALARREADEPPALRRSRDAIGESCYQATRYGLDARLRDDSGARVSARELALTTVRELRPYAEELGCAPELASIERTVREGNGADIQRRIHRERGMCGLLEWLVGQRTPWVLSL